MRDKNHEVGLSKTQQDITRVCDEIKDLLIRKNKAYGNSALDPIRVFSKASTIEQLRVRIDDKLSRISRGVNLDAVGESSLDTVHDLIGYLVLFLVGVEKKGDH